ncbi:leucine-rich repeat protein [Treponema socranskii]|uniref:leucine-rich repeat protein n=1 Tax=Treponema socranskii TaxID=53419 RepID=UPI003D6EEA29
MALKRCFIKTLLALIAVCAFTACTNPADDTGGGNTEGANTPSVPQVREYTVRFTAGEGGTITAKAGGQNIESGSKVKKDTLVTFTAVPDEGYITEGWTGAEADAQDTKTARVTVTSDLEVNVTFKPIHANTASYKIEHYKEALDGQYTATPAETDDKTGIIGTAAAVELKSYEGFEKDRQEPENAIISAGAVIKVYYKRKTVRITVKGDERVDEASSGFVDIKGPKTWGEIKAQIEAKLTLKAEWQGGDYGAYAWKLESENGEALTDGHTVSEDTTVYAVTNYTKFRMNGTVLRGYAGTKPRGRIIIPDRVTEITEGAFQGCTGFTGSLDLSACTQLTKIERYAFYDCSGFTGALKLPVNITEIGGGAFEDCTGFTGSLDLSVCTKLTKIERYAFYKCSGFTGALKLPVNITEISEKAFYDCSGLRSLDLSACTQLTKIGQSAFSGCRGFTGEFKLPVSITEIGGGAFYRCTGFTGSLDLSACTQLTKIEWGAFYNCSGFTGELKLPVSITEIGGGAFYRCTGFTGSLDLSACTKLTKIESKAFEGCRGFTGELKLPVSLTEIGYIAFKDCTGFTGTLVFPRSLKEIKGGNLYGAFSDCTGLTGLDFSACTELTEIGREAFYCCKGVTGSLDLSACTKLTKIEQFAFGGCSFKGELKLPANITEIEDSAFPICGFTGSLDLSACTKLTKIRSMFNNCSSFTGELKLPVSITEIEQDAFSGGGFTGSLDLSACTKLTKIGYRAFSGCSGFTGELKLPVSITEIEHDAFSGGGFTGSLDLSACTKLTKIGYQAFSGCSGFTGELKLPANITEIEYDAFSGCTKAEIKLPQSITEIEDSAFGYKLDSGSLCKKVKVPNVAPHYDRIKALVTRSRYPEDRIEAY